MCHKLYQHTHQVPSEISLFSKSNLESQILYILSFFVKIFVSLRQHRYSLDDLCRKLCGATARFPQPTWPPFLVILSIHSLTSGLFIQTLSCLDLTAPLNPLMLGPHFRLKALLKKRASFSIYREEIITTPWLSPSLRKIWSKVWAGTDNLH